MSLPLNKYQSEDLCLVNDKTNPPSLSVKVTGYHSDGKEKLYEGELHENDGSNGVYIDKHLLLQERINNEKELPLITAHPPSKVFYGVSEGISDTQSEVNIETSSICPPGCKWISRKQRIGWHDGEARSFSKGLADSTSSTFTLTFNSKDDYWWRDNVNRLGGDLAKSTSLNAFTLTINSIDRYLCGDRGKGRGEGLARSTLLTAFTQIINSVYRYLCGDWGKGLGEALAKSTSITDFTLLVNNDGGYLYVDWGKGLGEGLAKSSSITAFTVISILTKCIIGEWVEYLRRSLRNSKLLLSENVSIADSITLNRCPFSFDLDRGLRVSPPSSKWNRHFYHEKESLDSGSPDFSKYSIKFTEQKIKTYMVASCPDAKNERMRKKCTRKYGDDIFVGKDENLREVLL